MCWLRRWALPPRRTARKPPHVGNRLWPTAAYHASCRTGWRIGRPNGRSAQGRTIAWSICPRLPTVPSFALRISHHSHWRDWGKPLTAPCALNFAATTLIPGRNLQPTFVHGLAGRVKAKARRLMRHRRGDGGQRRRMHEIALRHAPSKQMHDPRRLWPRPGACGTPRTACQPGPRSRSLTPSPRS